jgi:hypothetical protein
MSLYNTKTTVEVIRGCPNAGRKAGQHSNEGQAEAQRHVVGKVQMVSFCLLYACAMYSSLAEDLCPTHKAQLPCAPTPLLAITKKFFSEGLLKARTTMKKV